MTARTAAKKVLTTAAAERVSFLPPVPTLSPAADSSRTILLLLLEAMIVVKRRKTMKSRQRTVKVRPPLAAGSAALGIEEGAITILMIHFSTPLL